jgi:hypothetical protein
VQQYAVSQNKNFSVKIVQVVEPDLVEKYNRLDLGFDFAVQNRKIWEPFLDYNTHPDIAYKNFVCSFNGSPHVSRKLLVSALHHFGWYNPEYVSKNFAYSADMLDGHLIDHVDHESSFYRKFFINHRSENFFQTVNSFGHVREDHTSNICALEHKLTQSFLHVVSETMATSYYPFVTEKFLYSVVTRGLFLAYAQPGWHQHLEKYYGIKRYTKLFDYRFDEIQNPVEQLVLQPRADQRVERRERLVHQQDRRLGREGAGEARDDQRFADVRAGSLEHQPADHQNSIPACAFTPAAK